MEALALIISLPGKNRRAVRLNRRRARLAKTNDRYEWNLSLATTIRVAARHWWRPKITPMRSRVLVQQASATESVSRSSPRGRAYMDLKPSGRGPIPPRPRQKGNPW